ncbi:hypothetical protein ACWD4J_20180 [Streptomyces sp. NPDC002577]
MSARQPSSMKMSPPTRTPSVLGLYADTVRDVLNVPDDLKLFFGISFGHEDRTSSDNSDRLGKVPAQENVIAHDTPGLFDGNQAPNPA